ncbi:2TM domain-containing protein [Mycetocola zhujimingii]|uniref:2TM domain-containing protein n=1 Tax=Mycetocola zhujimingii TaxID=2079792 RepID=UPI0018E07793|nr:2TM domain-containing protein [Mycetocola zhujimingii]
MNEDNDMNEDIDIRRQARRNIVARRIFTAIVAIWVIASLAMVLIWTLTTPDGYFWPIWPILGWAVAVIVAAIAVFGGRLFAIRDARVESEMARLSGTPNRQS